MFFGIKKGGSIGSSMSHRKAASITPRLAACSHPFLGIHTHVG